MSEEREWFAARALILVTEKNYSPRRSIESIASLRNKNSPVRSTVYALVIETCRRLNIIDRLLNLAIHSYNLNSEIKVKSIKNLTYSIRNLLRIAVYRIKFENHNLKLVLNTVQKLFIDKKLKIEISVIHSWLIYIYEFDLDEFLSTIDDPIEQLSLSFWQTYYLSKRLLDQFKQETRDILEYFKSTSSDYIRINTLKSDENIFLEFNRKNIKLKQDKYMKEIFKVISSDYPVARMNEFKEGKFYIQSRSSAFITHFLDAKKDDRILDACAAPGSKTSHIASLTENEAEICALELNKKRFNTLTRNLKNLNATNVNLFNIDATDKNLEFNNPFDKILIDAPCSGSGTISTTPYAKWRIKNPLIRKYQKIQFQILQNMSNFLQNNGILMYTTCSLLFEENEYVIRKFLNVNRNFECIPIVQIPEIGRNISYKGRRLFPHEVDSEGFSIFKLQKIH